MYQSQEQVISDPLDSFAQAQINSRSIQYSVELTDIATQLSQIHEDIRQHKSTQQWYDHEQVSLRCRELSEKICNALLGLYHLNFVLIPARTELLYSRGCIYQAVTRGDMDLAQQIEQGRVSSVSQLLSCPKAELPSLEVSTLTPHKAQTLLSESVIALFDDSFASQSQTELFRDKHNAIVRQVQELFAGDSLPREHQIDQFEAAMSRLFQEGDILDPQWQQLISVKTAITELVQVIILLAE